MQSQYPSVSPNRPLFIIIFGGLLGGAIGFLAGGLIGVVTCDRSIKEAGCLRPSIYGAIIGNSILMPICVQLINRRSGFPVFLLTFLVVSGIGTARLLVAFATGLRGIIIAIPIVQLIGCIAINWAAPSPKLALHEG